MDPPEPSLDGFVDGKTLKGQIAVNVAKEAIVMTDEFTSYAALNHKWLGTRRSTTAPANIPGSTGDGLTVHTNTAESFFALLKRGHYGTFHQLSKQHLHRYCNEFGFRWTERKVRTESGWLRRSRGRKGDA